MSAIELPAIRFQPNPPRLIRNESMDRVGERAIATVEFADPFWQVDMATLSLTAQEQLLLEAFREEASALQTVIFRPTHNCLPRAYWGTPEAPAVLDTGILSSVANGKTLAIASVTNGLKLQRGDLFSLAVGDYRSLHRVMVGATAAGGTVALKVEPSVPPYIAAGAVVRWKSPELNMRVVPGSFGPLQGRHSSATFSLVEVPK